MKRKTIRWIGLSVFALATLLVFGVTRGKLSKDSPFNGDRALSDVRALVNLGPRPSGSEALEKGREYLVRELEKAGFEPQLDKFVALTPLGKRNMVNIRAIRRGRKPETIAVAGHYDTKLFARERFVGANDGGSSAAVVLEMARVTSGLNLENSLEFILFDGEEAVVEWTDDDSVYGSRFDVDRRVREKNLRQLKALILVDMIGDKNLNIRQEAGSTGWLKSVLWSTARDLGYGRHFLNEQLDVSDDHVPYLRAGIPAIDIIDFDYPYWHTPEDTLDKVSAESLKIVGDVVYFSLMEIDRRLRN